MRGILHLNLHREFFAQIAAGTKRTTQLLISDLRFPICQMGIRLGRILKIKRWQQA